MNKKIEKMRSFFDDETYMPLTQKQIAALFGITKKDINDLNTVLNLLVEEGYLFIDDSKRYKKVASANMYKCKFEAKSKGFGFALYGGSSEVAPFDIYISKANATSALNGDTILVEVIKEKSSGNKKEGRIVRVLERANSTIVGTLQNSLSHGFVVPDNKKIHEDIYIPKKFLGKGKNDDKVMVEIMKWPENGKKAEGKIIEVIGNKNKSNMDIYSLLKGYDLSEAFPKEVIDEVKKIPNEVTDEDRKNRKDLRNKDIVTIDGKDAKDLDDAVCVEKLNNGMYRLGVHIADVSNYVREKTNLDKEAIKRGTSVYVPAKVIPMLPKELSNGICSLNQGVDRCALSIDMCIDKNGNIIDSQIYKSIINVKHRMNYDDVYEILENEDKELMEKYADSIEHFKVMKEAAEVLNAKRVKDGTINFDIPESKIILDKEGNVLDIAPYKITFANKIIEEFMLAANMTIAEKMFWLEAPFIYRIHEDPDLEKLKKLGSAVALFGKKLKAIENIHPKEIQRVLSLAESEKEEKILSTLALRSLKVAKYSNENLGHFGLGAKYYCHFTSPIRRYPDLFIHRVITYMIENNFMLNDYKREKLEKKAAVYALSSSECEKKATEVERTADDMYKAKYMQDKIGNVYEGTISSVTSFGFFVQLENTVEGLVSMMSLNDDYYDCVEEKFMIIGQKSKKTYKLGDKVEVKVSFVNVDANEIDFELVEMDKK